LDPSTDDLHLDAASVADPQAVSQALLSLKGRLEVLERRTSESSPMEGLVHRLVAVEAGLQELHKENQQGKNKAFGRNDSVPERDGTFENTRERRFEVLEARLGSVEQLLLSEAGGFLSPRSSNPLSPKSPNPFCPRDTNASALLSPKPSNPARTSSSRVASFERRLGGLEARLEALAANESSGASALAEVRARVHGLDKRVQGLHRNVDLEAQLSKRVATAEWRLEQVRCTCPSLRFRFNRFEIDSAV
jgi:hypothetical protein